MTASSQAAPGAPAYLDHASTTPVLPHVALAVVEELGRVGNASSLHSAGRRARRVVEESRERVAASVGARPVEVVLTAGGTEADNLAVKGLWWARRAEDPRRTRVLASAVEHHAVLDPVQWLADHEGAEVVWLPVDATGAVDAAVLRAEIERDPASVALVTLMWANNEVGTLQPVAEAVAAAAPHGIPVHSDAVQAVGVLPVDFGASGLHALTLSGHKLGAPVGCGALLLRAGAGLVPVLHGGGHERGVRSGTLDTPGALGLSLAVEHAAAHRERLAAHLEGLRTRLVEGLRSVVPDAVVRGASAPGDRLPGIAHVTFPGCEGDSLLYLLDARGVECSTGSACQAGVARPSHVLSAMGLDEATSRGALRFSLGRTSTRADVDTLLAALGPVVDRARTAGLAAAGAR